MLATCRSSSKDATQIRGARSGLLAAQEEVEHAQVRWDAIHSLQELLFPISTERFFSEFCEKKANSPPR
jgi:hypothetical protein